MLLRVINCNKKIIWITGLSGSGKTTLGKSLKDYFINQHKKDPSKILHIDGDELRKKRPDLTFSKEDRYSNVFHALFKCYNHLNLCNGEMCIVSLITPLVDMRKQVKRLIKNYIKADYTQVYMDIDLSICEKRDPKGLYKKVRNGEIKNFTGIDSPYEIPASPDVIISHFMSIEDSIKEVIEVL